MVLDYSKFANIGDDDEEITAEIKKQKEHAKPENSWDTHRARGLLNDPLMVKISGEMHVKDDRDDKIKLADGELEALLTFICVQQHGEGADNTPRDRMISDLSFGAQAAPKASVLLAMMWAVQKRIDASDRPTDETAPLMAMLHNALNTLLGIAKMGSSAALFAELRARPDGAFAKRYKACELGKARFAKYAEAAHHEETRWHYGDMPPW